MEYFKILFKNNPLKVELDAPIILQETAIIEDTVDNKILLRNIFSNVGNQDIVAIAIRISLKNIFGDIVKYKEQDGFSYIYQDIKFEPKTFYGNTVSIELPIEARKAEVIVEKAVFLDGTIWTTNPENIVEIQPQREIEASSEFIKNYDENNILPIFYYVENKSCWQCTCGQINRISDNKCKACLREKEEVKDKFSQECIGNAYQKYVEEKKKKIIQENEQDVTLQKCEEDFSKTGNIERKCDRSNTLKYIIGISIILIIIVLIIVLAVNTNNGTKNEINKITSYFGTQMNENNVGENGWEDVGEYTICKILGVASVDSITHSNKIQYIYWHSNEEYSQEEYDIFVEDLKDVFQIEPMIDENYDYRWEFEDYYVYAYRNPNDIIFTIFISMNDDDWV